MDMAESDDVSERSGSVISPVLTIRAGGKVASMALSKPGHTLAVVTEVPDVSIYCTYTGAQLFSQVGLGLGLVVG